MAYTKTGKYTSENISDDGMFKTITQIYVMQEVEEKQPQERINCDLDGWIYLASAQNCKRENGIQIWVVRSTYIREKYTRDIMRCMSKAKIGELLDKAHEIATR